MPRRPPWPAPQVRACIDAAPHLSGEALALGLIDGQLFRDQAQNLAQRLALATSARAALSTALARLPALKRGAEGEGEGGDGGEAPAAAAAPLGPVPQSLVAKLLEQPDAVPAKPLKVVPLRRYAAALEVAKREQEAAVRRAALLAKLQGAVQGSGLGGAYRQLTGAPGDNKPQQEEGQQQQQAAGEEGESGAAAAAAASASGQPPTVATLVLQGPILLGPRPAGPINPFSPGDQHKVASLEVIQKLRAARKDAAVRAVVLRIDSPGEWRQLVWVRSAGPARLQAGCPGSCCPGERCRAQQRRVHACSAELAASCRGAPSPPAGGSAAASEAIHREVLLLRQASPAAVLV